MIVAADEVGRRTRRLLWINHFALPPDEGGGTRHFDTARELVRRDWSVSLAASDFHYASRRYIRRKDEQVVRAITEQRDGVEFNWLWSAPYTRNDWRRGWNWLSFSRSLLRWEPPAGRPDVVIGSSPHLFAALAGARLAGRWGVPFLLEVRDLWPESMIAVGGRKGVAFRVLDQIARFLYRRADSIICLAKGTAHYLEEERLVEPDRLVYVPNGVDPEACRVVNRPVRETFTVVYAGAHGPANGLDRVLEAARLLRARSECRFLLIGDGPAKEGLVRCAREWGLDNVEFRDSVPKSSVPSTLAEADAGLMVLRDTPLFSFGVSPNKLFDYLGASLPVICNVPGEVAEMVREASAGVQAQSSSAEALAAAVVELADRSPEARAQMGRSGRSWVLDQHGRSRLAERLDDMLQSVLAAS